MLPSEPAPVTQSTPARVLPVVLCVDDDRVLRLMMRHVLTREGYDSVEVDTGEEALVRLRAAAPPALVLLDAVLPGQDGFSVCRQLRELPGCADLPVLMITGLDDAASIDEAFRAGATDLITKPVNWALLRHRVRQLVPGRSHLTRIQQAHQLGEMHARMHTLTEDVNDLLECIALRTDLALEETPTGTRPRRQLDEVRQAIDRARRRLATASPGAEDAPPGQSAAELPPGTVVLVADDEDSVRSALREALERHGFQVVTANGGRAAVDALVRHADKVAVVLLDAHLPESDSELALTEIRHRRPVLPVVLLTAGEAAPLDRLAALGVHAVLRKPFHVDDLLNTLGRALAK